MSITTLKTEIVEGMIIESDSSVLQKIVSALVMLGYKEKGGSDKYRILDCKTNGIKLWEESGNVTARYYWELPYKSGLIKEAVNERGD